MPGFFAAYARILHPYWDKEDGAAIRWSTMASRTESTLHAEAQWHTLATGKDGESRWQVPGPLEGSLEPEAFEALVDVLVRHTTTPDEFVCCFWSGFGERWIQSATPAFSIDARDYVVRYDRLAELRRRVHDDLWGQTPTMWWPADRACFVHSEIDAPSTYVGGSVECIEGIVNSGALEALPASLTDRFDADGDETNRRG